MMVLGGDKRAFSLYLVCTAVIVLLNVRLTWQDGDEARYVVLASAMAEGYGQVDIHLPEPVPEWLTPPLYPWLLSRVMLVCGDSLLPLRLFSVACYLLFAVVVFLFFRSVTNWDTSIRTAASLSTVLGVFALGYTWNILSETLYLLLATASLVAVQRREPPLFHVVLAGVLAGLCVLIRPVGLVMIAAGFMHYLVARNWRWAILFMAVAIGVNVPTIIRTYELLGVPVAYMMHYASDDGGAAVGGIPVVETLRTLMEGGPHYLFYSLPRRMFFYLFDGRCVLCLAKLNWLITPLSMLIGGMITVGWVARLRRPTVTEFYWFFYLLLISTYNQPNYAARGIFLYQDRYLLTLIPLAVWYLISSVGLLAQLFGGRSRMKHYAVRGVAWLCAAYVLATALGAGAVRVRNELRMKGMHSWDPTRYEIIGTDYDMAWARYVDAGLWIRKHIDTSVSVACRKSRHMYLFTGQKSFRYDGAETEGSGAWTTITSQGRFGDVLIIQDAFPESSGYGYDGRNTLDPLIEMHANRLELLHETSHPVTRVWRVKR